MPPTAPRLIAPALFALCALGAPLQHLRAQAVSAPATATPAVDSARAAMARGAFDDAMRWYDRALAADSLDRLALHESATAMGGRGLWQASIPRLLRLVRLGEDAPSFNYRLGQYLVWSGRSDSGTVFLRRAADQMPDSMSWRLTLAQTLTWNPRSYDDGVRLLRELLKGQPRDVDVRRSLAAALTWNAKTKAEGLGLFRQLTAEFPADYEVLTDFADALSWTPETRPEALQLYLSVPTSAPAHARASRGRLTLLSWSGNTEAALALADSLVSAGDTTTAVRKSRGTLLVQRRRRQEGLNDLQPTLARTPADTGLRETVAYALLGEGRNREARRVARLLPLQPAPGAADWVRRGSSPSVGIEGLSNQTSLGLSSSRLIAVGSLPISSQRVTLSSGHVRFASEARDFTADAISLAVTGSRESLKNIRVEGGVERYSVSRTVWSAHAEGTVPVGQDGELKLVLRRTPVEDSPLAAAGETIDGRFTGLVRANALDVSVRLPDALRSFGLRAASTLALYTGEGLEANFRRELSGAVFHPILIGASRVEAAVGFNYIGSQYNALDFVQNTPDRRGAYWSPRNFGNGALSASFSSPLTPRLTLSGNGLAGWQLLGRERGASQFNVSGGGGLSWIASNGVDFSASYLYLDNLGGFRLRQFRGSLRYSF